ncbi:MAG: transposase [Thermaceae bacterium]|nr:transposase [Thermaceae bacterium]
MHQTAQALLWTLLALLPTPHLRESLKALLHLLLTGHGKARPQHSKTKSPSALSRFLNQYPWPTRALIRLARKKAQEALHRARPRRGPKPRLLVVLDLVTLEKRGLFPALPLSFFHGKWGLHLVVVYLVLGELRIPWAYRVWRGKGEKTLSLLALRLLASLPPWIRKSFRLRVVADAAFGTAWFLQGVHRLDLEAVVGMRRDRKTREGLPLFGLKRRGSRVYLRGLPFPVWVSWYRYPLPGGGWTWRYVVATFPAGPQTVLVWGRRRFSIEHFFRAMKSEFSLARFGQRTALGVHRFLVLSLLAYLLAHWVKLIPGKEGLAWREVVRFLLPEMVLRVLLEELQRLGLWPPPSGRGGCLCGVLGRCKF